MNQIIYKVLLVFFWIGCAANLLLAQENERLGVKDMTPIL
jgi:hypothetical protein